MEEGTSLPSSLTENNVHIPLSLSQKFFFSLGHFSNDLDSAMWFTYLLIYFTGVANISSVEAGYLILLGQVVDGVSTLAIGYESDRIAGFCGYSKRKSWHLIGTVMTSVSFIFLFLPVIGGNQTFDLVKVIYYAPFCILFQMGWAFVQNSHLTLVAELTPNESERVALNSYRNAMTLVANVAVYGLVWLVFNKTTDDSQWSPNDAFGFMIISFSIVCVGGLFSTLFHVFTKEHGHRFHSIQQHIEPAEKMLWYNWFKEGQLYLIGIGYTGARLIMNVSQTYWPFYIIYTLHLSKKYSAIIPLVVYTSGFVTSLSMKRINSILGKKPTLLLGSLVMAAAVLWIYLITETTSQQIFGPAIIVGCGSTILLITTLSMISDMIGSNTNSGAFVFGMMSFVDKLSSGVALMIIQATQPQCPNVCAAKASFFKDVMTYVLLAFTLVCFFIFFALTPFRLGSLSKFNQITEATEEETQPVISSPIP